MRRAVFSRGAPPTLTERGNAEGAAPESDITHLAARPSAHSAARSARPEAEPNTAHSEQGKTAAAERARLLAEQYEKGKAINMAATLEIDAVVDPADTRRWLASALAAAKTPAGKGRFIDPW